MEHPNQKAPLAFLIDIARPGLRRIPAEKTLRDPQENDGTKQAKPTGLPALSLQTLGDPKTGRIPYRH